MDAGLVPEAEEGTEKEIFRISPNALISVFLLYILSLASPFCGASGRRLPA